MANYSIKANLLKIKGAFVTNLKGNPYPRRHAPASISGAANSGSVRRGFCM